MSNYEPQVANRFHEEKMAERPTISELANQLIEIEGQIPQAMEEVEKAGAVLGKAEEALFSAKRQQDNLCRARNNLIKELAKFQMVEYEGDDK